MLVWYSLTFSHLVWDLAVTHFLSLHPSLCLSYTEAHKHTETQGDGLHRHTQSADKACHYDAEHCNICVCIFVCVCVYLRAG